MLLALDVGNSQIHGGVFDGDTLRLQSAKPRSHRSSDELGVFLRSVLRENASTAGVARVASARSCPGGVSVARGLREVFWLRALRAAGRREDRAEDPLSQSSRGRR